MGGINKVCPELEINLKKHFAFAKKYCRYNGLLKK